MTARLHYHNRHIHRAHGVTMFSIHPIPAFSDNYIWCLADQDTGKALIVDPGQAQPVMDYLAANNLAADTILVTHHHPDHVGGIKDLQQAWPDVRVVGPAESPFKGSNHPVHPGDEVVWQGLTFDVLAVPGHTLDHLAYFSPDRKSTRLNSSHVRISYAVFCL